MLKKSIQFGIGATLLAAAQLSSAASAEIAVSDITLSVSGGAWWAWTPSEVDWVPLTAGASVELLNPGAADEGAAWHGHAVLASVSDGSSWAEAKLNAGFAPPPNEPRGLSGASASASIVANDGQIGWAFAKIYDGQILVGAGATFTLSATINAINASGAMAQANAYIEVCSTDFVTDVCDSANAAEAFVDGVSGSYGGPMLLTASWTNSAADATWAKMRFGLTASAESLAPVPEPATWAMALAGLAGLGALRKQYQRAA